jgi:uncharacterized membrane protein
MVNDVQDAIHQILINAIENAGKGATNATETVTGEGNTGRKALAATVAAAAVAPIALKGAGKLAQELGIDTLDVLRSPEKALVNLTANVGNRVGAGISDKVSQKVDEFGGPSAILKESVKAALPFGSGGDGKGGGLGVGKGRRMPVQQSIDIGVPLETVYNQWTQYELWPDFMHRVTRVTQEDDCTVSFGIKIWGRTKEFTASIETQRPDERIKWKVTQGMALTGVVTFHQLGPRLTRVLLGIDLEPGSLVEKTGRGLRHFKRAARGDLHRFKAFIEMQAVETGAWRGRIEDGAVVEEHDSKYDEGREYGDPKLMFGERDDGDPADGGVRARDRSANPASAGRRQRSRTSARSSGSRRAAGRSGPRQRSASRASGRPSDTKPRGRQAARKNS